MTSSSRACLELWGCRGGDCHLCSHAYRIRQVKDDSEKSTVHRKRNRADYHREYGKNNRKSRSEAQARWRAKKKQQLEEQGRVDGKEEGSEHQ